MRSDSWALERLNALLTRPKMYAYTAEALVAQVVILLELLEPQPTRAIDRGQHIIPPVSRIHAELFGGGSSATTSVLTAEVTDELARKTELLVYQHLGKLWEVWVKQSRRPS